MALRDCLNVLCDELGLTRMQAMDVIRAFQREGYTFD